MSHDLTSSSDIEAKMNELADYIKTNNIKEILNISTEIAESVSPKYRKDGTTPLMIATREASIETISLILTLFPNAVDEANDYGMTALMYACCHGKITALRTILEHKANCDIKNNNGWTALMCAALSGAKDAVTLLLDHGADINLVDNEGCSALMTAAKYESIKTVELLLDRGADVNLKSKNGKLAKQFTTNEIIIEMLNQAQREQECQLSSPTNHTSGSPNNNNNHSHHHNNNDNDDEDLDVLEELVATLPDHELVNEDISVNNEEIMQINFPGAGAGEDAEAEEEGKIDYKKLQKLFRRLVSKMKSLEGMLVEEKEAREREVARYQLRLDDSKRALSALQLSSEKERSNRQIEIDMTRIALMRAEAELGVLRGSTEDKNQKLSEEMGKSKKIGEQSVGVAVSDKLTVATDNQPSDMALMMANTEISCLRAMLEDEKESRSKLEAELETIKMSLLLSETELGCVRGLLEEERNARSFKESELITVQKTLSQLTEAHEVFRASKVLEVEKVRHEITSYQERLQRMDERLERDSRLAEEERERLGAVISSKQRAISELELQLENLQLELQQENQQKYENVIKEEKERCEVLANELESLRGAALSEKISLNEEISRLKQITEESQVEIRDLTEKIACERERLESEALGAIDAVTLSMRTAHEQELIKVNNEMEFLRSKLEESEQRVKDLQTSIEDERNHHKSEIDNKDALYAKAETEIINLRKVVDEERARFPAEKKKYDELKYRIETLQALVEEERINKRSEIDEIHKKNSIVVRDLEKEFENQLKELEKVTSANDLTRLELESKLEEKTVLLKKYELDIINVNEKVKELELILTNQINERKARESRIFGFILFVMIPSILALVLYYLQK